MMESGAILIYLAREDRQAACRKRGARATMALQWLMFQMGGVGPMFGQAHHFLRAAKEPVPYAIERYTKETRRLYGVLDARLEDQRISGRRVLHRRHRDLSRGSRATNGTRRDLDDFPNVKRWFDAISARPAVQKGMTVPS